MIGSLILRLRGAVLMAVVMIATALSGYAHHAPSQNEATVQAFLASGFVMADLCGSGSDPSAAAVKCLACTPPAPALVPGDTSGARQADLVVVAAVFAPRARTSVAAVHDPARATRGPPRECALTV